MVEPSHAAAAAADEYTPPALNFTVQPAEGFSGRAFAPTVRVLATFMAAAGAWGLVAQGAALPRISSAGFVGGNWFWFWAALAIVCWMLVYIWTSRITITSDLMRQTWIWRKEAKVSELTHLRILRIRGLEWLVAPRVYAHTVDHRFTLFYVADLAVLAQCEKLQAALAELNAPR